MRDEMSEQEMTEPWHHDNSLCVELLTPHLFGKDCEWRRGETVGKKNEDNGNTAGDSE